MGQVGKGYLLLQVCLVLLEGSKVSPVPLGCLLQLLLCPPELGLQCDSGVLQTEEPVSTEKLLRELAPEILMIEIVDLFVSIEVAEAEVGTSNAYFLSPFVLKPHFPSFCMPARVQPTFLDKPKSW